MLTVTVQRGISAVTAYASGEIDLTTAPLLEEPVHVAVSLATAPAGVVVDLFEVTFLDCAGVRALLACQQAAELAGVRLTVRRARGIVATILAITGAAGRLVGDDGRPVEPRRSRIPW